jgi:hypothetical protein
MTDEERLEELLDRWEQSRADDIRLSPEETYRDCAERNKPPSPRDGGADKNP